MTDEGMNNLILGILVKAVQDYEYVLRHGDRYGEYHKDELERFFRSPWYSMMCDIDGEVIMKLVRKKVSCQKKHLKTK